MRIGRQLCCPVGGHRGIALKTAPPREPLAYARGPITALDRASRCRGKAYATIGMVRVSGAVIRPQSRFTSSTERHSHKKRLAISSSTVSPGKSLLGPNMKKTIARSRFLGSLRCQSQSRRWKIRSQSFSMRMPERAIDMAIRSPLANWITAEDLGVCRRSVFMKQRWVVTAFASRPS
jgi:hypothetical protein